MVWFVWDTKTVSEVFVSQDEERARKMFRFLAAKDAGRYMLLWS